jgi:hypothetical protein
MLGPSVASGIEEPNNLPGFRIKPRDVRSFETIAMYAGQCKVSELSFASMLSRYDVIYLERRGVKC